LNFIERLLGISPDGGSGIIELLLLAIPVCGLLLLSVRRRSNRQPRSWRVSFGRSSADLQVRLVTQAW